MAWRARQRSENKRAGGLKGRDRGWLPGSSQANAIGIPHNLVNKTRERTNTLVTREAAANIAGGVLTEPLPSDFGDGDILIDTRSLVVNTNQLGGIGRFRSQFNVDADGIKHARYYLPINPTGAFEETSGDCKTKCEKARPNSVIPVNSQIIPGITTQNYQNISTLRDRNTTTTTTTTTNIETVELNTSRTLYIFFTGMFGPDGLVTDPAPITNDTNDTIGYNYVMQEVTPDNWSGFYVTPLWNDNANYLYPVSFNLDGKIEFDYEITSDYDMEIQFKFEHYGYNDCNEGPGVICTEPYFYTKWVQLKVNSSKSHITINIPTQNGNEYNNIIFYLNAGTINITNVRLTCD